MAGKFLAPGSLAYYSAYGLPATRVSALQPQQPSQSGQSVKDLKFDIVKNEPYVPSVIKPEYKQAYIAANYLTNVPAPYAPTPKGQEAYLTAKAKEIQQNQNELQLAQKLAQPQLPTPSQMLKTSQQDIKKIVQLPEYIPPETNYQGPSFVTKIPEERFRVTEVKSPLVMGVEYVYGKPLPPTVTQMLGNQYITTNTKTGEQYIESEEEPGYFIKSRGFEGYVGFVFSVSVFW